MRVLLTGALGFVGPHLATALRHSCGSEVGIVATAKDGGHHAAFDSVAALDVTDRAAVEAAIGQSQPTHVVHLAGIAAPSDVNADPENAWQVHLHGTLQLARTILSRAPNCWLVYVSSGMVYGESAKIGQPLDENTLLAPLDEYSASKAAADLALGGLARAGLNCVRLRPFNHTGPGQSAAFVVPSFATQIARIEAGLAPPVVQVGNLEAQRDFLDVRDVARAYALVVQHTARLSPGIVLNVASGIPRRISAILESLVAKSRTKIAIKQDPDRQRSSDLPVMVGDARRLRELLQWKPEFSFGDTLAAVLDDCRARIGQS